MQYGGFAEVYDTLMRDVDYGAWATYIAGFLVPGASVAECACGTGELTVRLAAEGFSVTGLDISDDMLRVAQEKARLRGFNIPFVRQDMRALRLHRSVDAVVCACDGVNYLASKEDAAAFFIAAYAALAPGGVLLFDISSEYKLSRVLDCNTFAEDYGDAAYIWKNNYDGASRLIEMRLYTYKRQGEAYRRCAETHIQRAHTVAELTDALASAGFTGICAYEAFTKKTPEQDAQRIQFVAQRPA